MSAVFGQANRNNNNNNGNNGAMERPEMDRRMNNGTGMNGMGGAMNGGEMPQFRPGQNNGTYRLTALPSTCRNKVRLSSRQQIYYLALSTCLKK